MLRYLIHTEDFEIPCEHPKCEQLHRRFFNCKDMKGNSFHMLYRKEWIVVDMETGFQEFTSRSKMECFRRAKRLNEGIANA